MTDLDRWVAEAAEALGVADLVDLEAMRVLLLDVAREVAHAVERPAAPVTAFLLGLAAGRSEVPATVLATHAETLRALVARWPQP